MNLIDLLYKCQPQPGRGFLASKGRPAGWEEFATEETSSGQAKFLGAALADADWTHCAGGTCRDGWPHWHGRMVARKNSEA